MQRELTPDEIQAELTPEERRAIYIDKAQCTGLSDDGIDGLMPLSIDLLSNSLALSRRREREMREMLKKIMKTIRNIEHNTSLAVSGYWEVDQDEYERREHQKALAKLLNGLFLLQRQRCSLDLVPGRPGRPAEGGGRWQIKN